MPSTAEMLGLALQRQQAGALPEAEQLYRQILQIDPQHADALHFLGHVTHQQGKIEEAVACYRQTLGLKPASPQVFYKLGLALRSQGRREEAIDCYRQAIHLEPAYAEAHFNLGNAFMESGRMDEAVACFRAVLRINPESLDAHNNLAYALKEQGNLQEAVACYRQALRLKPDYADMHFNLGVTLKEQGKLDEAIACYSQALLLKPGNAGAHNNLGIALLEQEKFEEAVVCFRTALSLEPLNTGGHTNLGVALLKQGKSHDAIACHRQALKLRPDYLDALYNLGNALADQGKQDEAIVCYRQALTIQPRYPEALNNLGEALKKLGRIDEALICYRQALDLPLTSAPTHGKLNAARTHSNLLFGRSYRAGVTLGELAEAHAEYERLLAAPLRATWTPHANAADPDRRLRLGFVSADLGRHPVGFFLVRVLEHFDRDQADFVCYSDRAAKDEVTARFQSVATLWRDVASWSDDRLAAQIREDRVDILFDLAGHTAPNRLLVFARRPAPLQITWAGYVGTTGLAAMDYILADRHEIPPEAQGHYREKVLRMPDGYVCYDPPAYAPLVSDLPALQRGWVTFGSFNNPAKLNVSVLELWTKVLKRVPTSRLVLKYKGMDNPALGAWVRAILTDQGIEAERLELRGDSSHADLLAEYNRVDIALDPIPYNGGLTTCEALWMGVPVITCPGETFAGRHSLSHLSAVGLTETVARDLDEYVAIAAELAGELPRLANLRASLRQRMSASPLCDGKRFATHLLALLREAWRSWVGQAKR